MDALPSSRCQPCQVAGCFTWMACEWDEYFREHNHRLPLRQRPWHADEQEDRVRSERREERPTARFHSDPLLCFSLPFFFYLFIHSFLFYSAGYVKKKIYILKVYNTRLSTIPIVLLFMRCLSLHGKWCNAATAWTTITACVSLLLTAICMATVLFVFFVSIVSFFLQR